MAGADTGIDLGVSEQNLRMTDNELASKQQREMDRLRTLLSQAQTDAEALRIRVGRHAFAVRACADCDRFGQRNVLSAMFYRQTANYQFKRFYRN